MLHGAMSGPKVRRILAGANHAIGISDKVFVLVDSFIVKGAMRVGFMPIFVLAAQLCPKVSGMT